MNLIAPILAQAVSTTQSEIGLQEMLRKMTPISQVTCAVLGAIVLLIFCRLLWRGYRLSQMYQADVAFDQALIGTNHLLGLYQDGVRQEKSLRHAVYESGCKELGYYLLGSDAVDKDFTLRLRSAARITPAHMDAVRRNMGSAVIQGTWLVKQGLEGGVVRVLPVLGVIGTLLVWVVTPDGGVPAILAPLFISLVGFALARIGESFLVRRAEMLVVRMTELAADLSQQFDRVFVDHRNPLEALPSLGSMGFDEGPNFSQAPSDTPRKA